MAPPARNLIGKRFGMLTVQTQELSNGKTRYTCLCDCGNQTIKRASDLKDGFGRLIVTELLSDAENPAARCLCDCGNETIPQRGSLRSGKSKSCGCIKNEVFAAMRNAQPRLHPDEAKRRMAASIDKWKQNNRHKTRLASRKFYKNNKDKVKIYHHRRRAIIQGCVGHLSSGLRAKLMSLQGNRCAVCKCDISVTESHMDHIIPLAKGGPNTNDNIQMLCKTCNLRKGAKDPIDFMQSQGYLL